MQEKDNDLNPTAAASSASELEILHPEQFLTIAGQRVCVREYSFIEGLRLARLIDPFVRDLHSRLSQPDAAPDVDELIAAMAAHEGRIVVFIAAAADVSEDWVRGLNDEDGLKLLYAWWAANAAFFMRRTAIRAMMRRTSETARAPEVTEHTPQPMPATV